MVEFDFDAKISCYEERVKAGFSYGFSILMVEFDFQLVIREIKKRKASLRECNYLVFAIVDTYTSFK